MADPDLAVPIRDIVVADPTLVALLTNYLGAPAVFTRTPVPGADDTIYPCVTVSRNLGRINQDGVNDFRPVLVYELASNGRNDVPPAEYRKITAIAYRLRDLFHRQHNIELDAWSVIDQIVSGPTDQSSDKTARKVVTLTVRLAQLVEASVGIVLPDHLLLADGALGDLLLASGSPLDILQLAGT